MLWVYFLALFIDGSSPAGPPAPGETPTPQSATEEEMRQLQEGGFNVPESGPSSSAEHDSRSFDVFEEEELGEEAAEYEAEEQDEEAGAAAPRTPVPTNRRRLRFSKANPRSTAMKREILMAACSCNKGLWQRGNKTNMLTAMCMLLNRLPDFTHMGVGLLTVTTLRSVLNSLIKCAEEQRDARQRGEGTGAAYVEGELMELAFDVLAFKEEAEEEERDAKADSMANVIDSNDVLESAKTNVMKRYERGAPNGAAAPSTPPAPFPAPPPPAPAPAPAPTPTPSPHPPPPCPGAPSAGGAGTAPPAKLNKQKGQQQQAGTNQGLRPPPRGVDPITSLEETNCMLFSSFTEFRHGDAELEARRVAIEEARVADAAHQDRAGKRHCQCLLRQYW